MSQLSEKFYVFWNEREPRERLILAAAVPLVIFMLLYVLLTQVLSGYFELRTNYNEHKQQLRWTYEQIATVEKTRNRCSLVKDSALNSDPEELIKKLSSRRRVVGDLQAKDNSFQFVIEKSKGNAVLSFVDDLVCSGLVVAEFDMTVENNSEEVSAVVGIQLL